MEEKQSRVRWNDQELSRLAAVMAPRLLADLGLHPLDAVRAAQECLEPTRRREIKAWSIVEGRLQPKLEEALAGLRGLPPQLVAAPQADDTAEAGVFGLAGQGGERVEAYGIDGAIAEPGAAQASGQGFDLFGDEPALQTSLSASASAKHAAVALPVARHAKPIHTAASVTADPARIEAALIVALQSPVVEQALVELFARTMAKALLRVGAGDSRPAAHPARQASAQRVLLAGFPEAQQKALMEALSASFEVRSWKPSNGPQLFEALARLCKTVIFPEDADDEVDAGLRDMDVRVIRHAGNASRLIERIGQLP